jgi:hypothetical protein
MTSYEYIKNDFFPWMDDVYKKSNLPTDVQSWHIFWKDDPKNFYGFTAYIFWKTIANKYGYDFVYHYAYDDTTLQNRYGPFNSFNEMKEDYETEGGYDMPFPDKLKYD